MTAYPQATLFTRCFPITAIELPPCIPTASPQGCPSGLSCRGCAGNRSLLALLTRPTNLSSWTGQNWEGRTVRWPRVRGWEVWLSGTLRGVGQRIEGTFQLYHRRKRNVDQSTWKRKGSNRNGEWMSLIKGKPSQNMGRGGMKRKDRVP